MNKRFLAVVFVIMFLQNIAYSANWQELQASRNNAYIDLDSIVIKLPKLYYNVKYEKDSNYYIFNFVSNYNDKTSKIFSVDKYDADNKFLASSEKEENGYFSKSRDEKEVEIKSIPIEQDSINEVAYNHVCSIIKANNEKQERLNKSLIAVKIKKDELLEFIDANNVVINMQLQNAQDRDIKEFEGDINVYDTSNNKIAKLNIKGENIKKQSIRKLSYSWSVWDNTNDHEVMEIHKISNNHLIFVFTPSKIIFDDGTKL